MTARPPTPAAALLHATWPTPLGDMLAMASPQGLCLLEFTDQAHLAREIDQVKAARPGPVQAGDSPVLARTREALAQYFAGQRPVFDMALDTIGTPFQQRVWQSLLGIAYGQTWSYAQQAAHLGQAQAVRAVAGANGANKISIIIPCHRVIGSSGRLTGYGGGLARKQALLALEGAAFVAPA